MDGRQDLKKRTSDFALRIIHMYTELPGHAVAQVLGNQVLRSGTSIGAHYREAFRAKSNADFVNKIEGALQELDETDYWLDLLQRGGIFSETQLSDLRSETDELTSIFVSIAKKTKSIGE